MKKKIINGLLFAVAMVAATSSFVSCKDYDADNYNELQAKYLSLQDAFNKQVAAMKDYVLTSRYDSETGYSAAELAAKGTIAKRLDDLENDYTTLNGKFNNELDPTKVGSLAYQIAQNNIAIATAQGLAERDSVYLRSLLAGWDNGGALGDMVSEAAGLLTALKSDTAKYNFAYDTLSTYYKKWNEAVKLANEASSFIGANVKVQGKEVSSLQDMADAYDNAIADIYDKIEALKKDIKNLMKFAKEQVYGINLDAVENPIFGSINYPFGFKTTILAAYYGEFDKKVYFPAGDLDDGVWANETAAILNSELQEIGAPEVEFEKDIQMIEGPGNAGTVYMTINPSRANIENKEFTLRASDNTVSKVVLGKPEPSTVQIKMGWNRAASASGFYAATAEIKKDVANHVALNFKLEGMATEIQNIMSDWSKTSASDIAKLALAVRDGMKVDAPMLSVTTQWKDTLGWTNVSSARDIAAFSVKPLGYNFLYKMDFSGGIVKFHNKLTAKEKAIAKELINEIAQALAFELKLPATTSTNVVITADGKVKIVLPAGAIYDGSEVLIAAGSLGGGYPTDDIKLPKTPKDGGYSIDITPLIQSMGTAINNQLSKVSDTATGTINKYLDKIINLENKIFGKLEAVAKNPNRYIQPALIGKCNQFKGYFYPSRLYLAPTQVQKGQKIEFRPTTLTAEVVAPAYKKYVAVSGAWSVDDINDTKPAVVKQLNADNKVLNTVFNGTQFNAENGFVFDTKDIPAGTVVEFIYECLDYTGKVAGKKYYIEVY